MIKKNGANDVIIEPSEKDVAKVLAEVRRVVTGRQPACQQSPHGTTLPHGTARMYAYINPAGSLRLMTVSLNAVNLDELTVPVARLKADPRVTLEPLVPFVTKSLKFCNTLAFAKRLANPQRHPELQRHTKTRPIQIEFERGHVLLYRSGAEIVLQACSDNQPARASSDGICRFSAETLLRGRTLPDPNDKTSDPAKKKTATHFSDASLFAWLDGIDFPHANTEGPKRVIAGSFRGVPQATQ